MKKLLISLTILILAFQSYGQEKTGTLKIIAEEGIYTYIDGSAVGKTNKKAGGIIINNIPIGKHHIMMIKPFHEKKTKTVKIKSGKTKIYKARRFTPFSKKKMQAIEKAKEEERLKTQWAKYKKDHISEFAYLNADGIKKSNKKKPNIDKLAQFPGGNKAMYKYLSMAGRYPKYAMENNIQANLYISFTINHQGFVKNVRVLREAHPCLEIEALRIFKLMPRWTPATTNEKPIDTNYTVPYNFILR